MPVPEGQITTSNLWKKGEPNDLPVVPERSVLEQQEQSGDDGIPVPQ